MGGIIGPHLAPQVLHVLLYTCDTAIQSKSKSRQTGRQREETPDGKAERHHTGRQRVTPQRGVAAPYQFGVGGFDIGGVCPGPYGANGKCSG